MTTNPISIFEDGRLRPGIYKIQNIYTETYLDIEIHSRGVCCRPGNDLGEGRGLWEIKSFGAGYTVQVVEPGRPEQFCTLMDGPKEAPLSVTAYPAAWRVEVVDDDRHRGFEYVRFHWGTTKWVWDLAMGSRENGAKVLSWMDGGAERYNQIWRLIPAPTQYRT